MHVHHGAGAGQRGDARVQLGLRRGLAAVHGGTPPSTSTTSAGVSSPLSWPLAVTASRSGSRTRTTDRLPDVPRIQPKEAKRADSAARTAPASSRSVPVIRRSCGLPAVEVDLVERPRLRVVADALLGVRLPGPADPDRVPAGLTGRVQLARPVGEEEERPGAVPAERPAIRR